MMKRGLIAGLIAMGVAVAIGAAAWHFWPASAPVQQAAAPSAPPPVAARPPQSPAPAASKSDPVAPSFDVVRVSPNGQSVLAGRAEPGAKVTLFDGESVIATVTGDSRGEWVLTPTEPLKPGNHELSLTQNSARDGAVRKSDDVVVVAVPEPSKTAPGSPANGVTQSLAVLVPRQGEGPARALQVPAAPGAAVASAATASRAPSAPSADAAAGTGLTVDVIQYDQTGHLTASGHAPPDSGVLVYLDNAPVGTAHSDAKGDWSVRASEAVPVGNYALRADATGQDSKVKARVQMQFRRAEVPASLADNRFLVVQPGNTLWRIARRAYGEGLLFTEIYHANRSEIADPNLIYPGQIVVLPPG
jgi:nucleoid-associated protein YgaU